MKRTLLAAFVAVFAVGMLSGPALAGHCPKDVRLIDDSLKTITTVSAAAMGTAKALRDTGDRQHTAGRHATSLASLHQALKILDILGGPLHPER